MSEHWTIDELFETGGPLYRAMATDVAPLGGLLRCTTCGAEHVLSENRIARFLASGWPQHCGYTMRWVTQRELDKEQHE